jgi:hypothetical protein
MIIGVGFQTCNERTETLRTGFLNFSGCEVDTFFEAVGKPSRFIPSFRKAKRDALRTSWDLPQTELNEQSGDPPMCAEGERSKSGIEQGE